MSELNIEQAIEDCSSALTASNCPFSKWEKDFIESVSEQFEEKSFLTDKQQEILEKIWDKI